MPGDSRSISSTCLGLRIDHSGSALVALSSPTEPRPTSNRLLKLGDLENEGL